MITIRRKKLLPAGKLKRIHVNGAIIRKNKRELTVDPVYTVKCGGQNFYCRGFTGRVRAVQNFQQRLPSGAVAWLETRGPLELHP